ncbi:MAG TPA: hypothetical protein VF995_10965, partial [Actinomycetota bacterium]
MADSDTNAAAARRMAAPGPMAVDWEERVDFRRLHTYRLARARQALDASELGAVLAFDMNNVRYLTSTHIGEWARDKLITFTLLARGAEPVIWDFGSAAKHHRLYCPWLDPANSRAGLTGLRGAVTPEAGLFERAAREVKAELNRAGVAGMPLGVDVSELPLLVELHRLGVEVRDGQQVMLAARQALDASELGAVLAFDMNNVRYLTSTHIGEWARD